MAKSSSSEMARSRAGSRVVMGRSRVVMAGSRVVMARSRVVMAGSRGRMVEPVSDGLERVWW